MGSFNLCFMFLPQQFRRSDRESRREIFLGWEVVCHHWRIGWDAVRQSTVEAVLARFGKRKRRDALNGAGKASGPCRSRLSTCAMLSAYALHTVASFALYPNSEAPSASVVADLAATFLGRPNRAGQATMALSSRSARGFPSYYHPRQFQWRQREMSPAPA